MIRAITRWLERRRYRKSVEATLQWLLIAMPLPSFQKMLRMYPGILSAADKAFTQNESEDEISVRIAGITIADMIEKALSYEKKESILDALSSENAVEAAKDPSIAFWVRIIHAMEGQAFSMAQKGRIEIESRDMLMSEVIGALQGYSFGERSKNRVSRAITQCVLPDPEE